MRFLKHYAEDLQGHWHQERGYYEGENHSTHL